MVVDLLEAAAEHDVERLRFRRQHFFLRLHGQILDDHLRRHVPDVVLDFLGALRAGMPDDRRQREIHAKAYRGRSHLPEETLPDHPTRRKAPNLPPPTSPHTVRSVAPPTTTTQLRL